MADPESRLRAAAAGLILPLDSVSQDALRSEVDAGRAELNAKQGAVAQHVDCDLVCLGVLISFPVTHKPAQRCLVATAIVTWFVWGF